MITHLLKLIWNQRRANGLIIVELFLIFILLWVCNYQLYIYLKRLMEPMGFNYEHVYKIDTGDYPKGHLLWQDGRNDAEDIYTLVDRIATCPGVESVSVSAYAFPFAAYLNSWKVMSDSVIVWGKYASLSPEFIDVFRLKPNDPLIDLKEELRTHKTLVTIDVWEKLFPDEAMEKVLYWDDKKEKPIKTRGVITPMKRSAYHDIYPFIFNYVSRSEAIERGWIGGMDEIAVRVYPEDDKDFPARFKELMKGQLAVGNKFVTEVISFEDMKKQYYAQDGEEDTFYQSLFILGFFIVNVFLGIIGTFWLRTEGRKEEMGLRMAIGSSRRGLKSIMILEALLLLAIIWIPAVLICVNLGYSDILSSILNLEFSWETSFISILITTVLMMTMIVFGVLYPATESAAIEPAEALRYE